ncbi:VWA domain-containing protein [Veillonella sp. DNF00869]|uniref:VWA domain-containing protein n=1 Tax=Veillonella sp. DNF00869 TaxID=1384081 RepID=UPI00078563D4|nr:VWA domain-containing protein [Veillonella sp. DNF00869]KXB88126.1 von Willebrand factor type A domain protein [Veillonella sp. DNF00869]
MSVQLNTGIHLFLQEPLLRTLLISGEVGTGKTYALLHALLDRGRTYTTITSHTDVSAMQEAVDIQRTLETAQIVKQAHPWDVYDLLICEGLDHFDRSMWLRILYEQNRRYEEGRPLQIIGTYTGAEGLSEWVYDMDLWIPIESPDADTRVRILADRDHADIYENGTTRESYHGEGTFHEGTLVDVYKTHEEESICSKGKLMDAPGTPFVHDSIYTYISSLVERFNISFMGMEYILLKAAIGLAREKGHQFVEPTDVKTVLPWTLPQKMKNLVNPRIQQDGEAQDSSDRMPSEDTSTEQEKTEETTSNRKEEDNISQGIDRKNDRDESTGKVTQGMTTDRDSSHEEQLIEETTLESNQTEEELATRYDGIGKEKDTSGEGQRESHRDKVEESFALSEAVETQVLHLYGMLQSGLAKKHIDISDDGRGPKVHRQGTMGRTIAWIPTIVQGIVHSRKVPIRLTIEDIRYAMYQEIPKEAIYLVVDTSGSMGQRQRLQGAEKLLSQLVQMMYVKRQYVSLITFQKHGAQCVVPLTQRIETIPKALGEARIGGRTPFVKGIEEAVKQIGNDMSQMGHVQAKVVIITDGKVTSQALQGLDDIGRWLANQGIQTTVIDTDTSFVRMNRAKEIAHMLGAELIDINQYIVI